MVDAETRRLDRGEQCPTPSCVAFTLFVGVGVVTECGGHRRLDREGKHEAGVLADREQFGDEFGVAREETGAVRREVGDLRQ